LSFDSKVFKVVDYLIHYNKCIISGHTMSEKQIHFRVSEEEAKKLENYAKKTKRTKTDIVREFLRSLP